jgi:hypothetical protein
VVDLSVLYGLVFVPLPILAGYWETFNVVQLGLAGLAFRLDGERLRPLWAMPLQDFVDRQLMYPVVISRWSPPSSGVRCGGTSCPAPVGPRGHSERLPGQADRGAKGRPSSR